MVQPEVLKFLKSSSKDGFGNHLLRGTMFFPSVGSGDPNSRTEACTLASIPLHHQESPTPTVSALALSLTPSACVDFTETSDQHRLRDPHEVLVHNPHKALYTAVPFLISPTSEICAL